MRWTLAVLSCVVWVCSSCSNNVSCQEYAEPNIAKVTSELFTKLNKLLYKQTPQSGNVLFSPTSIYFALASAHLGADGTTRAEIADLIGFPKDDSRIQPAHDALSEILKTIQNTTQVKHPFLGALKPTQINIAEGLFVPNGIQVNPSYASQVQSFYKGQVSNADFAQESSKATDAINQYVSKNTEGKIPQLFSNPVPQDTSILLADSFLFKASWETNFADLATNEENFNAASGNVMTKMMSQYDTIPYYNSSQLQLEAISIPASGKDVAVVFVLPYENQPLKNVIESLNGQIWQQIVKESKPEYVHYKLPKTKLTWSNDIKNTLTELGIKELFNNNAKLNNLASNANNLKVSQFAHATEMEFNERGTQSDSSEMIKSLWDFKVHNRTVLFYANRPFLFAVYHHKTGANLLVGDVQNP